MCSNEIKNNAIEHILERIDNNEKLILKNISKLIENWTLIDYESKFDEYSKKYPVYLLQLEYLKKHKNKVEIENGIALDMIFNYYNLRKQSLEEYNENQSKEGRNLSKEIQKKYMESISENNQLKNKIKELTNKNAKYEKNFLKKNKEYELIEGEARQLKLNLKDALLDSKNNNLKYKKVEEENLYLKLKNEELEEQLKQINDYFDCEYLYNQNEDINYKFSIINSSNTKLVEKIFPEVLFINANELNYDTLKKISRYTDNIYIQRSGILSSKINYIESWAKENDINTKIIMPTNEKEMIEEIVKIKIYNFWGDYNAN
ncbi:hypothetical protein [Clostridium novyi]|nr:hypothetical protein [Clostridium novyi]